MTSFLRKRWLILLIALFLLAWITLLFFVDAETIVRQIGVTNTYIVAFLLAVVGGLSTLTGISFFTLVVTFAEGGSNPWLLGLVGGIGIFISDCIFFFVARGAVEVFRENLARPSRFLARYLEKLPPWGILLGIFIYVGFTPLPNDLLMLALAVASVPFVRFAPALFLGSITVVTITAYLGESILWFAD